MNEKIPDLSFRNNQKWIIMMAFIWAVFMLPADIALSFQNEGLRWGLTLLGLVAFIIFFEIKLRKFTGGSNLAGLMRDGKLKSYPWPLLLGICLWHMFFRMWVVPLLRLLPLAELFGGMGGTV